MNTRLALAIAVGLFVVAASAQAQTTWYADDDVCPTLGVGTEDDPFCKIQDGIEAAKDGDAVLVRPGTYNETIDLLGKAIALRSSDGRIVTIINADRRGTVVTCTSGEGPDTLIEGFTITGGYSVIGGGMYCANSSPTVTDCTFSWNSANFGAGMFNFDGAPTVTGCSFTLNGTNGNGGGMLNDHSQPTVAACTFSENWAGFGAGMHNFSSSPTVTGCTFIRNSAEGSGGAMDNLMSSPTVINCMFRENAASGAGGAMINVGSSPTVTNCTIVGNTAVMGGGLFSVESSPAVANCVVWGNGNGQIGGSGGSCTFSDVQGGIEGAGNIDADPLFFDPDNGDYHLSAGSPALDAADNTAVPPGLVTDLDGNPRFVDDPATPDTGHSDGVNPIVDMGAYEYALHDCADHNTDGQVTMCHIPPGNPNNAHTITVSENAVAAHLAHWDHCGSCEGDDGFPESHGPGDDEPEDSACLADFDGSGSVDAFDLAQLLGLWGTCSGCSADVDGNGNVGPSDLTLVLGNWGPCE